MLLLLLCAAANDDYVAVKALYEATGGSGWTYNKNWDMSNTNVCRNIWAWPIYSGWNDPDYTPSGEVRAHCRAVRKCVLNAPCEKERCTVVRASKVYHPMALKTCVEK
jgi:hypothetical protein